MNTEVQYGHEEAQRGHEYDYELAEGFDSLPVLDLLSSEFQANSNRVLAGLRQAGPLCRVRPFGAIGVLRFADVDAVLRDFKTFSSAFQFIPPLPGAEMETDFRTLIRQDPPDHTRIRALVRHALSLPRLEAMELRIRRMVCDLVNGVVTRGTEFDLLEDLAVPLPVTVIAELLGIDPKDRAHFKRWSDDLVGRGVVHYQAGGEARARRLIEIKESALELDAYLKEAIRRRRREPKDDLITSFVEASEGGDVLAEQEIADLVKLLLIAGNETTTRLLGLAMDAFLHHPDQLRLLRESPELTASAVEEALRYEGPVVSVQRVTETSCTIAGVHLPAGTRVAPIIASANHDDAVFANPETFDIRRKIRRHLAFGGGVHACVGAPIARVEMRIALEELIGRMDDLAPAGPAERGCGFLRGFQRMPLRFVPRAGGAPARTAADGRAPGGPLESVPAVG